MEAWEVWLRMFPAWQRSEFWKLREQVHAFDQAFERLRVVPTVIIDGKATNLSPEQINMLEQQLAQKMANKTLDAMLLTHNTRGDVTPDAFNYRGVTPIEQENLGTYFDELFREIMMDKPERINSDVILGRKIPLPSKVPLPDRKDDVLIPLPDLPATMFEIPLPEEFSIVVPMPGKDKTSYIPVPEKSTLFVPKPLKIDTTPVPLPDKSFLIVPKPDGSTSIVPLPDRSEVRIILPIDESVVLPLPEKNGSVSILPEKRMAIIPRPDGKVYILPMPAKTKLITPKPENIVSDLKILPERTNVILPDPEKGNMWILPPDTILLKGDPNITPLPEDISITVPLAGAKTDVIPLPKGTQILTPLPWNVDTDFEKPLPTQTILIIPRSDGTTEVRPLPEGSKLNKK